ncbi:MAG: patatin-like phospholipase family protein [Bacteroidota bacterium]
MKHWLFLFLLLMLSPFFLYSQDVPPPKIGFAFGGGGAKGIAHIGVLKVLEEEGIYPDYITGTSIGSIIGGLYAIGYDAKALEYLAHTTPWAEYFSDQFDRPDLPIEERAISNRYQLSFPVENRKIKLPTGLVSGHKIALLLSYHTRHVHGIYDFDSLPIPFRCIAADFENGEAVVLKSGSLSNAIRASMSIPSVFEPVEIDNKLLIDGGVIRNLPVEDAIDMGADIVIAFDIEGPLYTKEELTSIAQVLEQTGSYMMKTSLRKQQALADVIIRPDIDEISTLDFTQIDTLLARGERAARAALPQIRQLIKYKKPSPFQEALDFPKNIRLVSIDIEGVEDELRSTLFRLLQLKVGKSYTIAKIEERMQKLNGSRFVRQVSYQLIEAEGGYKIYVQATPQIGDFVKISANYDSDLKAGLLLNASLRNRIANSSKLSIDLKVSENPSLTANYLIYTASRPNIGLHVKGRAHFFPNHFYEDGEFVNEFNIRHYETRLTIFSGISNHLYAGLGVGWERYAQNSRFWSADDNDVQLNMGNLYLSLHYDSYDRLDFPRKGALLSLDLRYSFSGKLTEPSLAESQSLEGDNGMMRFQYTQVFPLGKHIHLLWYNDAGRLAFSANNLIQQFYLGRAVPDELTHVFFAGLDYTEQPATSYAFSGVNLRLEPSEGYFISLLYNYGYYEAKQFDVVEEEGITTVAPSDGPIMGTGIDLGVLTRAGPANMTVEYNILDNNFNFALHMGYWF